MNLNNNNIEEKNDKLNTNKNLNINKNELNALYTEIEQEVSLKFNNKYISPDEVTNIEILRHKAINEYYSSIELFNEDLNRLLNYYSFPLQYSH